MSMLDLRERPGLLFTHALFTMLLGCSPAAVAPPGAAPAVPAAPLPQASRGDPRLLADIPDAATLADPLSAASLMAEIKYLVSPALLGRGSGTPYEQLAAQHLVRELDRAGIEPLGGSPLRLQSFTFSGGTSQNVLGIIKPPDNTAASAARVLVLGAHYDHLGLEHGEVYWGADDNASGTAVVLGVARALVARRSELARPVVIAFFGAEESGMDGSRAFVGSHLVPADRVFAMINVDMVGRPLADQAFLLPALALAGIDPNASVGVDGLRGRPGFERVVREACSAEHHRAITLDDLPQLLQPTIERLSRGRGDNWSFERAGIPAIFFSSSESSDYHQPTDTIDTLSPDLVEIRARIVLRTVIGITKLTTP
ncbi:MAG: M20/M25/M40 family metallo-hydrolase [Byssovorax sp.]